MTANAPRTIVALAVVAAAAACAPTDSIDYRAGPDMLEVGRALNCPPDRTPTCVERNNTQYSCFCMDEDAVRMILEPDEYQ